MTWLKNPLRDKFLAGALAAVPVVVVDKPTCRAQGGCAHNSPLWLRRQPR